jgi:hypothetical protein
MIDKVYDVLVFNTDATPVPPYGCMAIQSVELDGNELRYRIRKPTNGDVGRGDTSRFLFNKGSWIDSSKAGSASPVIPCYALVDESTGVSLTIETHNYCGPTVGSWYLQKGCLWNAVAKHTQNPHSEGTAFTYWIDILREKTLLGTVDDELGITTASGGNFRPLTRSSATGNWGAISGAGLHCKTVIGDITDGATIECKVINNVWFAVRLC